MSNSGICVFLCERIKKINSFQITVIIFKAYKKYKSPIQKDNKISSERCCTTKSKITMPKSVSTGISRKSTHSRN